MTARRGGRWKPILFAFAAAFLVALLGTTATDLGPWYQKLAKPPWQPPDWLFGPAWTIIFALAAISAAMAWRKAPDGASRERMVGLFALNALLNVGWSLLFFTVKRPDWALIETSFFWLSILVLIIVLWRYAKGAALLLVPYLAWVTFASVLNWEIVRLNAYWT